jgi:tetratricopeptide (TPR) repeat protein
VNKDNLLFATLGLLFGFVAGFLLQEVMAARQPPRRLPGAAAAVAATQGADGGAPGDAAQAANGGPGQPGAQQGAQPGTPPMAEVQKLKAYVAEHPNDAEAVLQLANLNFDIQNWPRARDLYNHYLELRPKQPNTLTDLGITYRQLKEYDRALDLFKQAQTIDPNHWQSRFNAVIVLAFDLKRYDEAESVLGQLKKLQPGNPQVQQLADAVDKQKKAAA